MSGHPVSRVAAYLFLSFLFLLDWLIADEHDLTQSLWAQDNHFPAILLPAAEARPPHFLFRGPDFVSGGGEEVCPFGPVVIGLTLVGVSDFDDDFDWIVHLFVWFVFGVIASRHTLPYLSLSRNQKDKLFLGDESPKTPTIKEKSPTLLPGQGTFVSFFVSGNQVFVPPCLIQAFPDAAIIFFSLFRRFRPFRFLPFAICLPVFPGLDF